MKSRAAVLYGRGQEWKIEEITVDPPKAGEVLVEWKVAGLCHSDEHFITGDMVPTGADDMLYPIVCGHEGAGIIVEVGAGVTGLAPGDHVSANFVPSCGRCKFCVRGQSNICNTGAGTMVRGMITDGTDRHWLKDGRPANMMAKTGTFAHHATVSERSVIKVDDDLPLEAVSLVSCGVATGWGSAVKRADTQPGDTVVVVGIGGIGINAVQGARMAGAMNIVAVDPIMFKREMAMEMGATHTFASMEEAIPHVLEMTQGDMADRVIVTAGVVYGDLMGPAMELVGKGGTCVVTGIAPVEQKQADVDLFRLAMWNKEIKGTIFGSGNPRNDIPQLLRLYRAGQLKLDELVTRTYTLDEINQGYQDMRDGKNIRGVVLHG